MNWKIIGFVGVAVIGAFVLGMLVSGGGSPRESSEAVSSAASETTSVATVWTCSMHPQIKLPKAGKCPICFMDLIPLTSDLGDELGPRQIRISETARKLAQIQTAPVIRGKAAATTRLLGRIAYDETRIATIAARVAGRVDKLFVDFTGERVTEGEELALIYSPELISAQQELLQSKLSLDRYASSESTSLLASAEANIEAAREKLRLLGFANEQIREIEGQKSVSDHLKIVAPTGGTVVEKMIKQGDYVEEGMVLYRIVDLSRLWVLIDAYESNVATLAVGSTVKFTSQSFPGEQFEAKVSFIDPTVNPMTRTVAVRATIENSEGRLKPEMFVSTEVSSSGEGNSEAQLLIPASAPLLTGRRAVVYVEVAGDQGVVFEGREVELGGKSGEYYIVKSGLAEGEMVVVNGAFKLDSELQIQAKPSLMSDDNSKHLNSETSDKPQAASGRVEISAAAHQALEPLFNAYFELQMGLALDDLQRAKVAAGAVADAQAAVALSLFTGEGHMLWMKYTEVIGKEARRLSNAESFEQARDAFFYLSDAMIELHESFGHAEGRNYYLTYCPMARDNKGAFWLQTVDTVWNSFYGDAMLRCGEIRDTLEPVADK